MQEQVRIKGSQLKSVSKTGKYKTYYVNVA